MKNGKFVGKINSLAQEFHYASPEVFIKIINIYCTSFHGSSLLDLSSKDCEGGLQGLECQYETGLQCTKNNTQVFD